MRRGQKRRIEGRNEEDVEERSYRRVIIMRRRSVGNEKTITHGSGEIED